MPHGFLYLTGGKKMKIEVGAASAVYPIYMDRGILSHAKEYIGRQGHVFIVSDDGVPKQYQDV